ncbi:hypothetical protein BX264_3880 [Streptomyces sp. 2333.5]|nr:hypothetical protein BX264_3880 [Streptomyces sp. 2333.5]SED37716.1 hypothetical protein SAMN05428943_3504 [Streptomyces sp. 2314.4]SEE47761.1 hypothetical protein SAMN05428942_3983 [Streptomyces sp. 2112.2]
MVHGGGVLLAWLNLLEPNRASITVDDKAGIWTAGRLRQPGFWLGQRAAIDALPEDIPRAFSGIHCRRRRNALIGSRAAQSRSERRLRAASCRSGGTSHRFTSTLVRDEATESLTPRGKALRKKFDHDFSRTLIWHDGSRVLDFPYVIEKIDWKGNVVTRKVVNEVNWPDPFTICHQ